MKKESIKTKKFGKTIFSYLNEKEFNFLFDEIFNKKIYYFKTNKTSPIIIDCGSHIGISILYFKTLFPNSKIYGFEPDKRNYKLLKKNIKNNKLSNVKVFNFALSDVKGKSFFYGHFNGSKNDTCGNTLNPYWGEREGFENKKIKVRKLSSYIKKYNLQKIDCLKLDVEGVEEKVLKDIKPYLKNSIKNFQKIKDILKKEGFKIKDEIVDISEAVSRYKKWVKKYKPKIAFIYANKNEK